MTTVTLRHAESMNGNPTKIVGVDREHDLSQFTGGTEPKWNSDEMAELLPKLDEFVPYPYDYDIKCLSLVPRCHIAESLLSEDWDKLVWYLGRHGVSRQRAGPLWDGYHNWK